MPAEAGLVARIDAQVDAMHDEAVAFLRELVRVPTDTPPGDNAPHAKRAAELLEAMGHAVGRHPVPAAEVEAAGLVSLTNLIVRRRFGPGPVVALNAHGDVVPPGEGWTKPPYEGVVEGGRMYGRGVAVSKSDFATYAFALRALEAAAREEGAPLRGAVELHFTYDEEFGGELGPAWLLRHGLSKPDFAIGAGFSYAIVNADNGCLQLEVTVHGRAAHAALPATGVDALQAGDLRALAAALGLRQIKAPVVATAEPMELTQTQNILVLGSDNRADMEAWRTDSIMVVVIDPKIGQVGIVSIPRDLYVDVVLRRSRSATGPAGVPLAAIGGA